jgi:hypothetical protein
VGLLGGAIGLVLAALASVAGNAIFRIWLKNAGVTEKVGALFSIPHTHQPKPTRTGSSSN